MYAKKTNNLCGLIPCTNGRTRRFIANREEKEEDLAAVLGSIKKQNKPIRQAIGAHSEIQQQIRPILNLSNYSFFKKVLMGALITLPKSSIDNQPR